MALFSSRRRWIEWVVIAMVLGWIGAIAWRHHLRDRMQAPQSSEGSVQTR